LAQRRLDGYVRLARRRTGVLSPTALLPTARSSWVTVSGTPYEEGLPAGPKSRAYVDRTGAVTAPLTRR
jgi:hypothetical protein